MCAGATQLLSPAGATQLLTPAATGVGVIAPLMSAPLLPLVQRASLVCSVLLYTPFLYCYARFQ